MIARNTFHLLSPTEFIPPERWPVNATAEPPDDAAGPRIAAADACRLE
jgi:hypothetical protein